MTRSGPEKAPVARKAAPSGGHARPIALIIDDDRALRYTLRESLRRIASEDSFDVLEAAEAASGLAQARSSRPDVIFLDLQMPGMDGFELLDVLKGDPELRDVPVIVHSSRELDAGDLRRLERASGIVPKRALDESAEQALTEALSAAGVAAAAPSRAGRSHAG